MLPTDSYPMFMQVLSFIRQGYLPTRACRQAGISWTMLRNAVRRDEALAAQFEEALLECRDQLLESLVTINNPGPGGLISESDSKMATVISSNIKWVLEKMWPEKFMAKVAVMHSSTADAEIIAALNAAIQRIPVPPAPAPPPVPSLVEDADYVMLPVPDPVEQELAELL